MKKFVILFIIVLMGFFACKKETSESSGLVLHHISFINFNYFNSVVYFNYDKDKRLTRIWWAVNNNYYKIDYRENQLLYLSNNEGFNKFDTTFYNLDSNGHAATSPRLFNSNGQIIKTTIDDTLIYDDNGNLLCWKKESGFKRDTFIYYNEYENKNGIYQIDEWSPLWLTGIFGPPQKKLLKTKTTIYNSGYILSTSNYSYVFDKNGYVIKALINDNQSIEYNYAEFNKEYESP